MLWLAYATKLMHGEFKTGDITYIGLFSDIEKAFAACDRHAGDKLDFGLAPAVMPTTYHCSRLGASHEYTIRCFEIDVDYANPPVDLAQVVRAEQAEREADAPLQLQPVQSSNIAAIGYDKPNSRLRVKFTNGSVYDYTGVPAQVAEEFQDAASKGSYLARFIRPRFAAVRLDVADLAK